MSLGNIIFLGRDYMKTGDRNTLEVAQVRVDFPLTQKTQGLEVHGNV